MAQANQAISDRLSLVKHPARYAQKERQERYKRERGYAKPTPEKIGELLERVKCASEQQQQWRSLVQQAYEIFLPQRNTFTNNTPGVKKGAEVLDSTPQKALSRWASRKQQALVPPGRKYARLVPGFQVPDEVKEALKVPLEEQTAILFAHLALSNAATELHEAILDAAVSTGAVQVLDSGDEERPLMFQACPIDELLVEEGAWGRIENVFRQRCLRADVIVRQWPTFEFHPETRALVEDKPETKVEILEACVYNPGSGAHDYCIIEPKYKHCAYHEIKPWSPWIVFRPMKVAGETYGRGPVLVALPAARTLQRVKELILRNAALQIAGLWKAMPDAELDPYNVTLSAGGIVPVASMDNIEPLEFNGKFEIGDLIIKDLQQEIMEALEAVDLGQIETTPVRTATEIMAREQQVAADSTSSSARLQSELVMQVIEKSVNVLARRGLMAAIRIDGKEVDVEFEGPLARAQKNEDVLTAAQTLELLAPLGPAAMVALKPEVIAKKIAESKGLWAEAIRSDVEINAAMKQAAEASQMLMQQQVQAAGPAGPVGPAEEQMQ